MYSGTTLTKFSGEIMGAHQKIDRVARKHLRTLLPDNRVFPSTRAILHFEGNNGPDGIKRKSPAKDEPWHYFDPFNDTDTQLLDLIDDHYNSLVAELKAANREHAAFEAAWLAHALVDGLTPAHHYPYEEKLIELRGGEGIESRTSIKEKLMMPGDTVLEKLSNNWKMWGSKGLMTTHGLFELGVATIIAPLTFLDALPTEAELKEARLQGLRKYYIAVAQDIASKKLYEKYYEKGWTPKIALSVRQHLGPTIIRTVAVIWHMAVEDAGLIKAKERA